MSLELLNRGKEPGCLSHWQISLLAQDLCTDVMAESHAEDCAVCAQRLATERKQFQQAAYERVPAVLMTRAGRSSWWRRLSFGRWMVGVVTVAMLGAGALAWLGGRALQGKPWLLASIHRQCTEVAQELPADQLGKLLPGDELRLRVAPRMGVWTRAQVKRGERWEPFFEGLIPDDGWLPAGLTMEGKGKTQVRLWSCGRIVPEGKATTGMGCKHKQITL